MRKLYFILSNDRLRGTARHDFKETDAKELIAESLERSNLDNSCGFWEWADLGRQGASGYYLPELIEFYNLEELEEEKAIEEIIDKINESYAFVLDAEIARFLTTPELSDSLESPYGLIVGADFESSIGSGRLLKRESGYIECIDPDNTVSGGWDEVAEKLWGVVEQRLGEAKGHIFAVDDDIEQLHDKNFLEGGGKYSESSVDYPIHYFHWDTQQEDAAKTNYSIAHNYIRKLLKEEVPCSILVDVVFQDNSNSKGPKSGGEFVKDLVGDLSKCQLEKIQVIFITDKAGRTSHYEEIQNKLKIPEEGQTEGVYKLWSTEKKNLSIEPIDEWFQAFQKRKEKRKEWKKEFHKSVKPKILDTQALIDGRIVSIAEGGFIGGLLVVPKCVLNELKGSEGIENLKKLKEMGENGAIEFKLAPEPPPDRVDDYEVEDDPDLTAANLTEAMEGALVTGDSDLQAYAEVTAEVLRISDLADKANPGHIGEYIDDLKITGYGNRKGEGVGEIEGQKVVVNGGAKYRGKNIPVVISEERGSIYFAYIPLFDKDSNPVDAVLNELDKEK